MKKIYDVTFDKGAVYDDDMNECITALNPYSHKPTKEESKLVDGDIGDFSYYTIMEKKVRIIVYIGD